MSLTTYKKKRNFKKTTEPKGKAKTSGEKGKLRFVVQRHHASRLHYDFRLEMEGVLKSWAVPKGPSLNPQDKRLAMMVEDHPYDYKDFEGEIPDGYGKGNVMIYDEGFYEPVKKTKNPEKELLSELKNGSLKFVLKGKKLKGEWALVKMKSKSEKQENAWLLIKHKDRHAVKTKFDIESEIPKKVKEKGNKVGVENASSSPKKTTSKTKKSTSKSRGITAPQSYYTPMLTKLVDDPFTDKDWIFENKFDGYRAIASVQNGKVQLYSRNHNSFNKKYPSLVKELQKLEMNVVLDGEILALDEHGNPKFQLLQNHQRKKVDKLVFYVFDIIYLNGHETINMELSHRKELLDSVFQNINSKIILQTQVIDTEGEKYFEKIKKQQGEGIIAKRKSSLYSPGKRNHDWLKIKTDQRQESIICGFTAPQGARKFFGSLILGIYEDEKLVHIGNCGTGFKEEDLKALHKKMKPLIRKTSPFEKAPALKNPIWITPKLICEVKFSEWTTENNMRHPVFIGLRSDKKARQIIREIPVDEKVAKDKKSNPEKKKSSDEKKNIQKRENDISLKLNGHKVELTNRNKIFWPEEKITKGDLLEYYHNISEIILPYLKNRPLSLNRHPNGPKDKGFFQKDINRDQAPKWIKTEKIHSESNDKDIDYLICNNEATLMYMVNLGCIEINPWLSRIAHLDKPDYLLLDLDPVDIEFEAVVETALAIKESLDDLGLTGFCKTSGSKGIHIYVPFAARYSYETTRLAAKLIASHSLKKIPKIGSLERSPKNRKKKVYLDYLQNSRGQTVACPYSVRPKPGATVSTPLEWNELNNQLNINDFNIHNMQERLNEKGDLWKKISTTKNSLKAAIKRLEEL
ncbi:MAG TPA: DNA ligase D [Flavobacteriaceae bacterium]|nr:DNA ligase D [Flavobacteriaceae bacterium]